MDDVGVKYAEEELPEAEENEEDSSTDREKSLRAQFFDDFPDDQST
jgi:hypothetical protein